MPTITPIEFISGLPNVNFDFKSPFSQTLGFDNDDVAMVVDNGTTGIEGGFGYSNNVFGSCGNPAVMGPGWEPGDGGSIQVVKTGKPTSGAAGAARQGYIHVRNDLHPFTFPSTLPSGWNDFSTSLFQTSVKIDNFQPVIGVTCFENLGGVPVLFQKYTADLHTR